jgi:hypothetical protein
MKTFKQFIEEEGEGINGISPTNNVSNVQGLSKEPVVTKKKQKEIVNQGGVVARRKPNANQTTPLVQPRLRGLQ